MNDEYVTLGAWHQPAGREDAIDEVADQFERPVARGAEAFWSDMDLRRGAPIRATVLSFVPRTIERRAG